MQHVSWLEAGTRRRYLGVIDASCSEVCIQQTNVSRTFYSQFVHLSKVVRWLEAGRMTVAGFCWDTAEEEAAVSSGSGRQRRESSGGDLA